MGRAYYNEFDPYAAQWLRNLIEQDLIAPGDVDERSIVDVQPSDLDGYTQCHFFAGIGGWSFAARLAGWPDDRELWTGSCPCQPFSAAGKQTGQADERHLWPVFAKLIAAKCPSVVMGEQVAKAVGFGWLDGVCDDLEASGYAVRAAVLPAHSVGAPHSRDRLYFVADTLRSDAAGRHEDRGRVEGTRKVAQPWAYAEWQGGRHLYGGVADGIPARMAKSAAGGFGNAIVPQVAAEVIGAYLEAAA